MSRSALLTLCALAAVGQAGFPAELERKTTSADPPRKVIVGTVMQRFWVPYPGLDRRLEELTGFVDRLARQAREKYGRGLDLAILPEAAVTGELPEPMKGSVPLAGPLQDAFSRKAREHGAYIVVPTFMLESDGKSCSNVAILFGRKGEVVGIYRKLHLAVASGTDSLEGGVTPGKDAPVFQCDFGKLGIQICFDIVHDYGWEELARKGAELVAWPTQSPQTARPAFRALKNRYYVVSSTWRNNASVFEPTGRIVAQIKEPEQTLVEEIDLSYALLPWSSKLQHGKALQDRYGDKVGFRYYTDEDLGIFWSNDPRIPVRTMIDSLGLTELETELPRIRKLYRKAGVPGS
ncbi:MAG: carbon-nitrogen hydrolase family protein [Bryobacteraceae bacterium]|nr:carbon-nitrogen hydrolase family protein [Bryobacteraceae bacterium]